MNLIDEVERQIATGVINGVTLSLWALRQTSGEPRYSATVRWQEDRENGRGKGETLTDAFMKATGTPALPAPPGDLEGLINELGYAHMNIGLSGLSSVDLSSLIFINARLNFREAPLMMGRGANIREAIKGLRK